MGKGVRVPITNFRWQLGKQSVESVNGESADCRGVGLLGSYTHPSLLSRTLIDQMSPPLFSHSAYQERKSLTKGGFRDKHFDAGSLLLGGGVFLGVAGCLNTYTRTGKLFPGPHLYAGAGTVLAFHDCFFLH